MALTAKQIQDSLVEAFRQSASRLKKLEGGQGTRAEGEFVNALRDFGYQYDTNKLQSLPDDQLASLVAKIEATPDNEVQARSQILQQLGRGRRNQVIANFSKRLRGTDSALGSLTRMSSGGIDEGLLRNRDVAFVFDEAARVANALQEFGLTSVAPEEQFRTVTRDFTPQAQVAREAQQVEADRQRVQESSQSPQSQGRLGEPVIGLRMPDGTWVVKGINTGTIFQKGLASASEANSYATMLQSGSAPNLQGRPDLYATPVPDGQEVLPLPDGTMPREATREELALAADGKLPTREAEKAAAEGGSTDSSDDPEDEDAIADVVADSAADTGVTTISLENWDALLEQGMKDAKTELSPYFQQQLTRGKQLFEEDLVYQTEQRKLEIEQQRVRDLMEQEQQAASSAEAGLASSGIRQKAEARLAANQENVARSQRLQFQRGITTTGRRAEDVLGSGATSGSNIPSLDGSPVFTATPGVRGSLEEQQITSERSRASELARQAALRKLAASGEGLTADLLSLL